MGDASEDIDVETEEYFYDLVQISPDEDEIIAVISEGRWYQIFLMASTTRLSNEEKLLILDKGCVDWAGLSADVLMAIATFRATTLRNAAPRSKMLTAAKLSIFDCFQESYYLETVSECPAKMGRWQSAFRALAIEFCRLLEEGSLRDKHPLHEIVAGILTNDWTPTDDAHATTIYYIAGAILQTITNLASRSNGEMESALNLLQKSAKTTKAEAKETALPSARVEQREKVELSYASPQFYNFLLKVESVYHSLLKEKNVALFGVGLVCDIGHVLEWFIDETGFSNLLPHSVCSETKTRVYRAILCSYSNTRGKDYSYKKNAMAPPNTEQTLRARLAIASAVAKTKREKLKSAKLVAEKVPAAKRRKVAETASAAPVGKDNTTQITLMVNEITDKDLNEAVDEMERNLVAMEEEE